MSFTKIRQDSFSRRVSSGRKSVFETSPKQNTLMTPVEATVAKDSDQTNLGKDSLTSRVSRIRDVFDFHGSSNEHDDSVPDRQPVCPQDILKGVTAYIEVRSNTENRFEGISKQMEMLGAKICKKFTSDVTHVVFKDGKNSTKEKAIKKGVHLVSVLWIDSCKHSGKRVSEELFPVSSGNEGSPLMIGRLKRSRSMQPKSFEEDVKHSAERVEKRKRRLELLKARTPEVSSSFGEVEDAYSPFLARPSLSPHLVPRTTADFLGKTIHSNPTESSEKFKQICNDSSEESDIEHLAKKLRFESVHNKMTTSSSFLTNDKRQCGSDEHPQLENDKRKKKTKKLLSLKQNSAPITSLPDPVKSQFTDKLKKSSGSLFDKENACPVKIKKSNSADEKNGEEQKNSKKRKCNGNGSTKKTVNSAFSESGKTGQANIDKSCQVRTSLEDFREGAATVNGDCSKRKTRVDKDHEKTNKNRMRKKKSRCLVMTSMRYSDQEIVVSVVKKLGRFSIQDNVCSFTSHVVAGNGRRTLNVLKAISRGCWLLSLEWVMKSLEAGRWIEEEPYELSDDFPSAQLCRLERATKGDNYHSNLLAKVGVIYVGNGTSPSSDEILNLILMSGGHVCHSYRNASICIGQVPKKVEAIHVSEKWLLDCITSHSILPFENYQREPLTRRVRPPSPMF